MQPPMDWQSQLVEAAAAGQHEALSRLLQQQQQQQEGVSSDALRHALGQALLAAAAHGQALCCQAVLTAAAAQHLAHLIVGDCDEAHLTPLMLAAQKGFDACIPILLSWAPLGQLTAVDEVSRTALIHAACGGHVNSIRALLQQAPDSQLTAADADSWTALHHATGKGHVDCMAVLLVQVSETQLTAKDKNGTTALGIAAMKGHTGCITALLEHAPEVQLAATDEDGYIALHHAACEGHADCVQALLRHVPHAQLTATDAYSRTALHRATLNGYADCIKALLVYMPDEQLTASDANGWTALHISAADGDTECVTALLVRVPEQQLAATTSDGCTALHVAAREGHAECVTVLLMHVPQRQLTAMDEDGWTALHHAAYQGSMECVAALLEHITWAQLGATDLRAWRAAVLAVQGNHAETADMLVTRMVDLKMQVRGSARRISSEAVYCAASWGKPAVLRLLLHRQLVGQRELDTALMETLRTLADEFCPVTSACKTECVRLLLAHKARLLGVEDAMFTQLWPILHDLAGRLCPDSKAVASLAEAVVGLAAEVRSQQAYGAAAGAAHLTGAGSSSKGSGQHKKRACADSTYTGTPAVPSPAAVVAKLFQWAAQGDCWQLQRVLSFRDTPQPHLDTALIATLTAGMAEGVITAERQVCALLLMARGARLQLQFPPAVGQAVAEALAALWPMIKDWAAAAYVADAATQAVQGGAAAVQLS